MNLQQKTFCYEYAKDFNAIKAYVRAGYSERSAPANASLLLNKPEIDTFIKSLLKTRWQLSKDQWLYEVREEGKRAGRPSDRLRALELYGKAMDYVGADTEIKNYNILAEATQKLSSRIPNDGIDTLNKQDVLSDGQGEKSKGS